MPVSGNIEPCEHFTMPGGGVNIEPEAHGGNTDGSFRSPAFDAMPVGAAVAHAIVSLEGGGSNAGKANIEPMRDGRRWRVGETNTSTGHS